MDRVLDIPYIIKEKILDFLYYVKVKFGFKRIIAVAVAVAIIAQLASAIIINSQVLGKDGLSNSEKSEKLIHIELSEKKYAQWLNNNAFTEGIHGEGGHKLVCEKIGNYSTSHSYVIISHPYGKLPYDMAAFAYHFYDLGFHIYLPYMRGFGKSDYRTVSMGVGDYKDILKWVEEIVSVDEDAKIFIYGLGLGGTASLLTADKGLPENVKGIIADSAYSDIKDLFKHNFKEFYSVNAFPTIEIASVYNKFVNGWSFDVLDVETAVKKSSVPILYIQGGEDQIVPVEHINDLYDVTYEEHSGYVLIPGATHCEGSDFEPEKYWSAVDLFVLNTMDL